ncbi:hypothetical protein AWC15_08975 [Mycobacterium lacus]|nr:hypothetical protein AWC15_08975 [Mycobacterium lacus]
MTPHGRPHDIDAGGQDPPDVVHRIGQAGIAHGAFDDALRFGGQNRVEVTDGCDAHVVSEPGQRAGVLADLLRSGHTQPCQFEPRIGDERGQR